MPSEHGGIRCPKPASRATEKRKRKAAKDKTWRLVQRDVRARDEWSCRACRKIVGALAGHVHHIRFRSKQGSDTVRNCILVCAECHADIHAYRLAVVGEDANKVLRFERV